MKTTVARAAALAFPLYVLSTPASADDLWGCEVLLCLSNPAGPTAVAQCVPPIERLWRHLAALRPFPRCAFVGPQSYRINTGIDESNRNGRCWIQVWLRQSENTATVTPRYHYRSRRCAR